MKTEENARIGKIAALTTAVREEINMRLLNGELAPQILPWLNELPEARRILAERFEGKPVQRQNLSHWRAGGYQEWLRARVHAADTSKLVDQMVKQAETRGETLLESVTTLLAEQLLTVLSQMAAVMGTEGREDGESRMEDGGGNRGERRTSNTQHSTSKAEVMGNGEGDADGKTVVDGVLVEAGETLNLEPSSAKAMEGGPRTLNLEHQAARLTSPNAAQGESRGISEGREDGGSRMEDGDGNRDEERTSNIQHSTSKPEVMGENLEMEAKMALMERRLGLLAKATACVARLRKVDQAQATLALNRERLAVSAEANQIKREKLELMRGKRGQEPKPEATQKADKDALPTGIHEWTDEERRRLEKTVGLGFGPEMPGETPWEDVKPFDLTPDQKRRLDEAKRRL